MRLEAGKTRTGSGSRSDGARYRVVNCLRESDVRCRTCCCGFCRCGGAKSGAADCGGVSPFGRLASGAGGEEAAAGVAFSGTGKACGGGLGVGPAGGLLSFLGRAFPLAPHSLAVSALWPLQPLDIERRALIVHNQHGVQQGRIDAGRLTVIVLR